MSPPSLHSQWFARQQNASQSNWEILLCTLKTVFMEQFKWIIHHPHTHTHKHTHTHTYIKLRDIKRVYYNLIMLKLYV